jgi:hypothetical protein
MRRQPSPQYLSQCLKFKYCKYLNGSLSGSTAPLVSRHAILWRRLARPPAAPDRRPARGADDATRCVTRRMKPITCVTRLVNDGQNNYGTPLPPLGAFEGAKVVVATLGQNP